MTNWVVEHLYPLPNSLPKHKFILLLQAPTKVKWWLQINLWSMDNGWKYCLLKLRFSCFCFPDFFLRFQNSIDSNWSSYPSQLHYSFVVTFFMHFFFTIIISRSLFPSKIHEVLKQGNNNIVVIDSLHLEATHSPQIWKTSFENLE